MVHVPGGFDLLRGHVGGGAETCARYGERGRRVCAGEFGQAEVGDLRGAGAIKEDVLRFDVAVEHAFLVRVLKRVAELGHQSEGFAGGESARALHLAERDAVHIVHEQPAERRDEVARCTVYRGLCESAYLKSSRADSQSPCPPTQPT